VGSGSRSGLSETTGGPSGALAHSNARGVRPVPPWCKTWRWARIDGSSPQWRASGVRKQHQGLIDHPFGQYGAFDEPARGVGRLAVEDLPAADFAAVEVDDHPQIEKQPLDRPRQPGAISGPDLMGASGLVGRWPGSAALGALARPRWASSRWRRSTR
jgi:hypothetical protein